MTLNAITEQLKDYFNNHRLINTVNVTIGDDDLNAINNIIYPLVNIQYINSTIENTKYISHNFKIIIGDRTSPNVELIDMEIFSDTLQIADDFTGWLDTIYEFDWINNVSVEPFSDSNVDRVSGVVFTITILSPRLVNSDCLTPYKN